jgi:hypothetical protein
MNMAGKSAHKNVTALFGYRTNWSHQHIGKRKYEHKQTYHHASVTFVSVIAALKLEGSCSSETPDTFFYYHETSTARKKNQKIFLGRWKNLACLQRKSFLSLSSLNKSQSWGFVGYNFTPIPLPTQYFILGPHTAILSSRIFWHAIGNHRTH